MHREVTMMNKMSHRHIIRQILVDWEVSKELQLKESLSLSFIFLGTALCGCNVS